MQNSILECLKIRFHCGKQFYFIRLRIYWRVIQSYLKRERQSENVSFSYFPNLFGDE